MTRNGQQYDVVVIGGSAAGLSGALTLTRARRSVVVLDDGTPRNAPAAHLHGYLSRDGAAPADLVAAGREEVAGYGGEFRTGTVRSVTRDRAGFVIELADGSTVAARRVLVATGTRDVLPDVPGLAERFGRDVLHCPYCHGWEVRDQPIAVLASTPMSVHQAQLFRQWSGDVTLLQHRAPDPSAAEREGLDARGIAVVSGEVVGLLVEDDALNGVRLADGRTVACRALVVGTRVEARGEALTALGLQPAPFLAGGVEYGTAVASDPTGRTAVDGVWLAGNVTTPMVQLIAAAAAGTMAGAAINADLIAEEVAAAVAAGRDPFSAASEAEVSRRVLGDRRHELAEIR